MERLRTELVIPCFNEASRLRAPALAQLLDDERVELRFVDDGSTDSTAQWLEGFARAHEGRVHVLRLERNSGKAEAVRRGLCDALASGPSFVGYLDADLATPPSEILRLLLVMQERDASVVLGSRVALLGRDIERNAYRHYVGRVFGTLASLALQLEIYDTQCGAKLFRASQALRTAVSEPFLSRWAFDIELLGRLLTGTKEVAPLSRHALHEEPLLQWHDIAGSKLSAVQMAKSAFDLARIAQDLQRRRRLR